MTKEEMLNGMSEQEFYDMYPTQEDWADAQQMKLGGLSGAPHNGQPTADEFFSYGSHYNDSVNVPMGNPYYAAEGGTPYYGGPTRPYAYGGGLPGGANEYDMPCMNCGGYMEEGGDYNSPTNYGSFNVPMAYGGMPMAQPGVEVNPELKAFLQQRNVGNIKNTPSNVKKYKAENNDLSRLYPNKNNFDLRVEGQRFPTDSVVSIPNNPQFQAAYRNGKFTIAGTTPAGIKQAASINEGSLKQGKDKMIYADYSDIYKEDGGVLDASNNMSYPTFEDGGKYNLLNLIKAASKKMKKAYGGDTVTQGGNSDNYPQGITQAFKNGIKNNTMNALMNEEQESFSNEIKQMGGYSGGYNQQPQFDRKNQAMQSMYQQRIDDTQANLKNDFSNFGQSMNYLGATANPYTKTSVKAQTGTQTGSRNMSPEEWAWMDEQRKAKENQAQYNKYFSSQSRGMNRIPMNYNYNTKISKKSVAALQDLAKSDSSVLKEFSHRHFGPWSKTKMTFDYNKPYDNSKITLNDGPDKTNALNNTTPNKTNTSNTSSAAGSLPSFALRPGVAVDNIYTPHGQTLNLPNSPMRQGPTQGAETRAEATQGQAPWYIPTHGQFPLQNAAFDPNAAGPGHRYGGGLGYYQTGGNPIQIPESVRFVPKMAQEGEGDDVVVPGAPKPDGFNPDQVIENKPFVPGYQNKSTATITQKTRPGFSGEGMANVKIAKNNLLSSFVDSARNDAKNQQKLSELRLADNAFVSTPANAQSRGDYDPNSGMFRPDDMVPVQFAGYGAYGGSFQDGGMQQQQPDPQQIMQGVATMLQQGAQPEQVAKQLVEMGIPQEQVIQIIQAVMQQLQGGQEPQQQPMRYGGFATGGAAEEESYEEDLNEDEIAELRAQGYDVEYI
jgi:hypothetical protein